MNKLFTKIAALFLGATMAVGVGVAVGSNKEVARVDAAADTYMSLETGSTTTGKTTWTVDTNKVTVTLNQAESGSWNGNTTFSTSKDSTVRFYVGEVFAVVPATGYKITGVKITNSTNSSYYGGNYVANTVWSDTTKKISSSDTTNLTLTNCSSTTSGQVSTIVSKQSSGVSGIYISTSKQSRPSKFEVKYTAEAITHTVTINVNNSSYGNVNKTSVTNVADNANISASGAVLTVGSTTVTATPTAQSDQYTYAFSNWSGIPAGGKVTANITVTANFTATTRTYNVTNSVSNASFTGASTVTYGTAYSGTFTADSGYILPASLTSVTIKGTATNNYSYNSTTGDFSIAAQYVTGAIVITGACQETGGDPVGITYSLSNCTIPGKPSQMYPSQEIELTIVPDDHYKLPTEAQDKVNVTGASDWVYDDGTGIIMIDGADGAVSVSVECVEKAQNTISMGTLIGVSAAGGNPTEVEEGATVTLTFTENSGYVLPTSSGVTVTGTGSSFTWTQGTGKLQITGGTGDITVSIIGVLRDLTDGSLTLGTKKTSYTTGDDFELPSTVTANFNAAPLTANVKNDVVVSGPVVKNSSKYIVTSSGTITLTYTYEPTGSTQSASYAITATPITPSAAKFVKVTSGTVTSGKYLIVNETASVAFNGGINSTSYDVTSNIVSVSIDKNEIAYSSAMDAASFTFDSTAGTLRSAAGYYIYRNGTSSGVTAQTTVPSLTTSITVSNGNAVISNVKDSSTMRLRYNNSSGQDRFRYYSGDSVEAIQIYKYQEATVKELKWITAEVKSGTYYKGNSVTASDFIVTGHYNDGTPSTISSSITVTDGYLANIGTNTVTLTYNNSLSCTATVTAVQAPVTSVELDVTSASIGLDESYWLSDISVTINPSIAIQNYTWSLEDDGGLVENVDYTFDGDEYHSINPGTVVFRCTSDADASKYADFTLTITGVSEAAFAKESTSGYEGKNETVAFTYANIDIEDIDIVSDDESIVTIGTISGNNNSGTVVINFVGSGTTTVNMLNGIFTLDTLTVSVSADSVVSVTWSATDIDVWSGATLSTTGWNVQYEMASGDHGTASSYVIKLVGQETSETITAGYVFKGSDNGKTIHVEYGNVSSTSINVTVTQRINNVWAPTYIENDWGHELTSQTWSEADSQTLNGKSWTMSGEDDGTGYMGWDNTKGQQFGSGKHPYSSVTLSSEAFEGTISKVEVTTSGASSVVATVSVSVGNTAFKCNGDTSVSISADSTKYTFTGSGSGTITISWANSSSKAIYFKVLGVTSLSEGESVQIANSESHKEAQRAAVKFANAFNTAMDKTENCTTGLNAAWSECASAYNTFLSDCAALETAKTGEGEYAKNLVRYATAQYSDDSGEACIERMMRTYEICVNTHGMSPFMNDLKSLDSNSGRISTLNMIIDNGNTVTIVVIISVISLTAIGGYFFLRKRREEN